MMNEAKNFLNYALCGENSGGPLLATLILTNRCNLRCVMCEYSKKEKSKEIGINEIKKICESNVSKIILIGGEVFLRPDILDIIRLIKARNKWLSITTNGTLVDSRIAKELVSQKVDRITISIDGLRRTHNNIRGNNAFEKAISGLENLCKEKNAQNSRKPKIFINTMLSKKNFSEISELVHFLNSKFDIHKIMLNYLFDIDENDVKASERMLNINHDYPAWYSTTAHLMLNEDEINFVRKSVDGFKNLYLDPFLLNYDFTGRTHIRTCVYLYYATWITPEGRILACPMMENYVIGDISENTLQDAFNNVKYKNFRRVLRQGNLPICRKCCMMKRTLLEHIS